MSSDNVFSSSLFSQLYKSRETLINIFKTIGYDTNGYDNFTSNEVHSMLNNKQLDMLLERSTNKIYIKYFNIMCKKLQKTNIRSMIDDLFYIENILNKDTDKLMIITNEDANDTLVSYLKNIWEQEHVHITIISIKRLQFNILNHSLVPKHIILNNEEKDEFYKKYNIMNDKQIPEISRFDPVSQVIGMIPGNICKIIRPSKTAITTNYYRLCVNH
jgi:DNA-directed RNA polymerase subunit H (RpoH/RPB5)